MVSCHRKKLGKPQPINRYKLRDSSAKLERWKDLDWRQTDAVLGRRMKVSRERARQMRAMLGKPKATLKALPPRVIHNLSWLKRNCRSLRGLTVVEAERKAGFRLASGSVVRRFLDSCGVLRFGNPKHPWHLVNFHLSDVILSEVWGIDYGVLAVHRARRKIGPAKWSGNVYRIDGIGFSDAKFVRALSAEKEKAKQYLRRFGGRVHGQ